MKDDDKGRRVDLHDYYLTLRRRWIFIVLCIIAGGVVGYLYSATQPERFQTTSSVFVASERGETVSELVQGSQFTQNLMRSYAELALLPIVLDPVIEELGLDESAGSLADRITSEVQLNTVIIHITVSDTSAQRAADIANATTTALAEAVADLSPTAEESSTPAVTLNRVSTAPVPTVPYAPSTRFNVATGAALGFVFALLYAVLKEIVDTRVRTRRDIERVADVAVLSEIPAHAKRKMLPTRRKLGRHHVPPVLSLTTTGQVAEAYRRLAVNLEFAGVDGRVGMIVVTSASPGEGKTTTAVNLALALAERHGRVLLVDGDLRNPHVAEACGVDGTIGLTSSLVGGLALSEAVQSWSNDRIDVLPGGVVPPNPSQLIGSLAMENLVAEMRSAYDFVIIDSPPLLPVSDSLALARLADGALLVTRYKKTRRQHLAHTLESLNAVGAHVVGVVLNDTLRKPRAEYYGYSGETARPSREAHSHREAAPIDRPKDAEPPFAAAGPSEVSEHSART